MEGLILVAVTMAGCGPFGAWVAIQKGRRPKEGLILGLAGGPFGVLVESLLPSDGEGIATHKRLQAIAVVDDQQRRQEVLQHLRDRRTRRKADQALALEAGVRRRERVMEMFRRS